MLYLSQIDSLSLSLSLSLRPSRLQTLFSRSHQQIVSVGVKHIKFWAVAGAGLTSKSLTISLYLFSLSLTISHSRSLTIVPPTLLHTALHRSSATQARHVW